MIKKDYRKQVADLSRKNDQLRYQLSQEKEKVSFLALFAADIDIDEMFSPEESTPEEELING